MAYSLPSELGTNFSIGLEQAFLYTESQIPGFIPIFLLSICLITTMGSYILNKRFNPSADFFASFTVGCILTSIVTSMLKLVPGLVNTTIMTTVVGITLISLILLFVNNKT